MRTGWQKQSALRSTSMNAGAVALLAATLATGAPPVLAQGEPAAPSHPAALPFLPTPPLRSYVAIRRLVSENERHHKEAWLVARTELREDGTFTYDVLEEGGSELIRRKVLHEALKKELLVHNDGRARRSGLTADNYEFAAPVAADGVVRVLIEPRRRDDMLVKGTLVTSEEGELLRVEGELVKRPSFWTKSVRMVRQYDRIAGTRVPVRLDMVAQVRLAGTSTFSMIYEYQQINGQLVGDPAAILTRAVATARPASQP